MYILCSTWNAEATATLGERDGDSRNRNRHWAVGTDVSCHAAFCAAALRCCVSCVLPPPPPFSEWSRASRGPRLARLARLGSLGSSGHTCMACPSIFIICRSTRMHTNPKPFKL